MRGSPPRGRRRPSDVGHPLAKINGVEVDASRSEIQRRIWAFGVFSKHLSTHLSTHLKAYNILNTTDVTDVGPIPGSHQLFFSQGSILENSSVFHAEDDPWEPLRSDHLTTVIINHYHHI